MMTEIWIASLLTLWIVVIFMGVLLAGTLRQVGLIALRLGDDPGALITDSGLDRGTLAPDFEAVDVETGDIRRLSELPAEPRVLVFLSDTCLACRELVPAVNEVMDTRPGFDFVVLCHGDVESCLGFKRLNELRAPMLVDTTGKVEADYDVRVTPFAYVLDYEQRVLIRGVANDWTQLEALIEQEGTLEAERMWTTVDEEVG